MLVIKRFFLKYYVYILSFFIPVFVLFFVYALMRVYPFGERSILTLDLYHQYIFYYEYFYNIFHEGANFFYSFNTSLGSGMMGLFAYYLSSPFSFVLLVFPRTLIVEATLFIILLKVGTAGLSFAIFLKNSRKSSSLTTLIFSIMYALMSYVIIHTMNPMFLDGVILLPIIILGVEKLINENNFKILIVSMSLLFITNFYIGYMTAFFIFIYFLYYYFLENKKFNLKDFLLNTKKFFLASLLSVLNSMWILLPTYFVLQTGKFQFTNPNFVPVQQLDIFDLFSKMLPFTYDSVNFDGLPFVFSGTIVLILSLGYFFSKQISNRSKILSALFLLIIFSAFSVSTIDILLHGFQGPNWLNYRYSFVFSFFLLVISYEFFILLKKEKKELLFKITILLLFIIALINRFDFAFLITEVNIWLTYLLLFVFLINLLFIKKYPREIIFPYILLFIVIIEMFFNSFFLIKGIDDELFYSNRSYHREHLDKFRPLVEKIKEEDENFYRIENSSRLSTNDSMALNYYGLSHSTSTLNQSIIELLFQLGYYSTSHWSKYRGGTILSDSLLGIKYVLGDNLRHSIYKPVFLEMGNVYENPYYMPMAFPVDQKIKEVNFTYHNPFENQNYLISYLQGQEYKKYFKPLEIIDIHFENLDSGYSVEEFLSYNSEIDILEENYIDYTLSGVGSSPMYMYIDSIYPRDVNVFKNDFFLETYSVASGDRYYIVSLGTNSNDSEFSLKLEPLRDEFYINNHLFYYLDMQLFESAVNKFQNSNVEVEKIKETHIVVNSQAKKGQILFTSIPFDSGWKAYANGERVDTVKVLNSLLAVELKEGENEVVFKFVPQGFVLGLAISFFSLLLSLFFFFKKHKESKKRN